jgi:hypothetical protein
MTHHQVPTKVYKTSQGDVETLKLTICRTDVRFYYIALTQ